MEFTINEKIKRKMRRKRMLYEGAFSPTRKRIILYFATFVVFVLGMIAFGYLRELTLMHCCIFGAILFCVIGIRAYIELLRGTANSFLFSPFMTEKRWIEDRKLCFAFEHVTEGDGELYEYPIGTISDVVADPRTGRIRFSADEILYICRNLDTREVKKKWIHPKSIVDVYDYTEPSIIDALENYGIDVEYIRM